MSELNTADIAIVGGGLVGTPLAIMLAKKGWTVALFEQQVPSAVVPGSKGYTALSDATVVALDAWQLWEKSSTDACAIHDVHVSHKGYFGSTHISAAEHKVDALGYVVDNAQFLDSFQEALVSNNVQRYSGAEVEQIVYNAADATVDYKINERSLRLNCKLVIAVDGVSSSIRSAAGINTVHTDYDQVGVLGLVRLSQPHNHVAYERFTPSGPLALLPRPENTASFVYCIDPNTQDEVSAMSDEQFLAQMQSAFGHRLGQFESIGERVFVPLVRIEATQQVASRLVLLGNAMRLLHPVAGQGYNLAIRDVEQLVQSLSDTDKDPGDQSVLQAFAQSRLADHKQVVRMTDLLARTFRGKASMPAHARALGLLGLDRIAPLRKRFTRKSMGHA